MAATDARKQIDGARPAGRHGNSRNAGDAPGGIGGEGSRLLMMHTNHSDLFKFVQRILQMGDHAAGQFVHGPHAPDVQKLRDVVRSLDRHVRQPIDIARVHFCSNFDGRSSRRSETPDSRLRLFMHSGIPIQGVAGLLIFSNLSEGE